MKFSCGCGLIFLNHGDNAMKGETTIESNVINKRNRGLYKLDEKSTTKISLNFN